MHTQTNRPDPNTRRQAATAGLALPLVASLALGDALVASETPPVEIRLQGQLVSLSAEQVPARLLLERLAQYCGLVLEIDAPLQQSISLNLHERPLHEVIDRVLGVHSYVLHYRRALRAEAGGGYLWVLSDETSQRAEAPDSVTQMVQREARLSALQTLVDSDAYAAQAELRSAASDSDPQLRAAAIEWLGEIGDSGSEVWLRLALSDPDESVREAAIDAVASRGGKFALHSLTTALSDPAVARREQAMYAVADLRADAATELLQLALTDGEPRLRKLAAELLAERG